jgi:hypothetical protein
MVMIFELREAFTQLQAALHDFNQVWMSCVVKIDIYEVPLNNNGLAPKIIPVTHIESKKLFKNRRGRLKPCIFKKAQHPATAYRLSGWIAVNKDLSAEIAAIND